MSFMLKRVSTWPGASDVLWRLLEEREPEVNISHVTMPTCEQHEAFVKLHPYRAWYIVIDNKRESVGAVYLTYRSEIGVGVLKAHRRRGIATWAIGTIMKRFSRFIKVPKTHLHLGREFYANINPANEASIRLFESMGFGFRQSVYALKVGEITQEPKASNWKPKKPKPAAEAKETELE